MPRFGPFEVDFTTGELHKSGTRVRIQEQPLLILETLLKQPGELVTRAELRDRLWPSGTFVDFERSLNAAVGKLRQCLNDSASRPIYVETVARRGYRFVAPVTESGSEARTATQVDTPAIHRSQSGGRFPWTAAGVLVPALSVMLWAGWLASSTGPEQRVVSLDLEVGSGVSQPAISPDGRTLAFVANGRLAIRKLAQTKITPLAGTEGASSPFFSPDAQWVGYFAGRKLRKVAVEGGEPVTLCDAPSEGGGTWTEDGRVIAALGPSGDLSSVPAAGGVPRPFGNFQGEPAEMTHHGRPVALPGGKGILFISGIGVAPGLLRVLPPGGGPAKNLVEGVSTARFLPSGYLLLNSGETMYVAPMDPNRLELTGQPFPLVEGMANNHFRGGEFDVSATGTLVYRNNPPSANRAIVWVDPSGAGSRLIAKTGEYASPSLSPNGRHLALVSESKVWIYDLARETMSPLALGSASQCCPVWSPDGQYVVFASQSAIALARWDGTGAVERLPVEAHVFSIPFSFSQDGRWLSFHRNQPLTGVDLWAAPVLRTGGTLRLAPGRALLAQAGLQTAPVISPDSKWIAYSSNSETGRMEVNVIPFSPDGTSRETKWQVSTDGGRGPRWSGNGAEILFRSPDDHLMAAAVAAKGDKFHAGKPRLWSTQRLATTGPYPNFAVAPDGKRVIAIIDAMDAKSDETHLRLWFNIHEELRRLGGDRKKIQ